MEEPVQELAKRRSSKTTSSNPEQPIIVGIGASAGGLQALQAFFNAVKAPSSAAYVVVQHLSPDFKSFMVELLAKQTKMPVLKAREDVRVRPNHVYLIPPRAFLRVKNGRLRLEPADAHSGLQLPIDILFRSLAEDCKHRTVAIVLSGTGSDGTVGIRAVKEAGGLVLVQDEASAQFNGMPRSAIATGMADYVLPPEEMPAQVEKFLQHPFVGHVPPFLRRGEAATAKNDVIALVRERTGVDLEHYKNTTIDRRIERRMSVCQITELSAYRDYLQASSREADLLLNDVLIGVTSFFRDPEAWSTLSESVLPELLERSPPEEPVRAWVAGCSTGEEAYSLAIAISEVLTKLKLHRTVKIFATDLSNEALTVASRGRYTASEASGLSAERLDAHFVPDNGAYQVNTRLRDLVVFAHHNLLRDSPFTRLSIVSCRNVLIYLRAPMQERLLTLFNYALRNDGVLFLGSSESVGDSGSRFQAISTRFNLHRNRRLGQPPALLAPPITRLPAPAVSTTPHAIPASASAHVAPVRPPEEDLLDHLFEYIASQVAPPCVVIDERDDVVHVIGRAGDYLKPPPGRFTRNLLRMTAPSLSDALHTALQRARRHRDGFVYEKVRYTFGRRARLLRLTVRPFHHRDRPTGLRCVFFEDLGAAPKLPRRTADRPKRSTATRQYIVNLERDLATTRESLQTTVQELESSNEEIQAANEELLASNEELQSTNEELQSVNEELHTVNTENQNRIEELTRLTNDINNLLATAFVGVVLIDSQLRLRRASASALPILGLTEDDLGTPIETLARLLARPDLPALATTVMKSSRPTELEVQLPNKSTWLLVRLTPFRTELSRTQGVVLSFVDNSERHRAQAEARLQSALTQSVLDAMEANVAILDPNGQIVHVNEAWRAFAVAQGGVDNRAAGVGANYFDICARATGAEAADTRACLEGMQSVLQGRRPYFRHDYRSQTAHGPRWFRLHVAPLSGSSHGLVIALLDITADKLAGSSSGRSGLASNPHPPPTARASPPRATSAASS